LRETQAAVAGKATVQLLSVPAKTGIDQAQKQLIEWLAT
jgi:hypothetical protein